MKVSVKKKDRKREREGRRGGREGGRSFNYILQLEAAERSDWSGT